MNIDKFQMTANAIKNSDIYENPDNWEARGLNPSDDDVIQTLRKATNDFLENLETIVKSSESSETKLEQISNLAEELAFEQLDTEEREFLAESIAPAIESLGLDPWNILIF